MASIYSTSLRLELMATGDQSGTWGTTTNTNLGTLLEQAITGVLSVAEGDTTLTLTTVNGGSDQARNAVVNLTGALTNGRNVVVPTANKLYLIKNSTTGGFAVTVKTAAGTGVTVPATTARWVYCDGTNVVDGLSGPWTPSADDAQALGLSGTAWSDLFLASGGVINWNAGNATLTHSAGLLTSNVTLVSSGSAVGYTGFQTISTEAAAAAGPIIELYRNSASPAVSDILGQIIFYGQDNGAAKQEYGSIQAVIIDPVAATEDASLDFYAPVAGTRTRIASFGPNLDLPTSQIKFGNANNSANTATLDGYTDWIAYTPTFTGFGTVTGISIWSKRVGDTLYIRGNFTSGTATGVEARMTLGFNGTNANVNSDATKVPAIQYAGCAVESVASSVVLVTLIESNVGYITFGFSGATTAGLTKQTGSAWLGNTSTASIEAEIPISGW